MPIRPPPIATSLGVSICGSATSALSNCAYKCVHECLNLVQCIFTFCQKVMSQLYRIYLALRPANASGLCRPATPIPTKSLLSLLTCRMPCVLIVCGGACGAADVKGFEPPDPRCCTGIVTLRCGNGCVCCCWIGGGAALGSSCNVCSGCCGVKCGILYKARIDDLSCRAGCIGGSIWPNCCGACCG